MSPRANTPLALASSRGFAYASMQPGVIKVALCYLGDIRLLLLLLIKALTTTLTAPYARCTPRSKAEELQATLMYYNSLRVRT